jgi:hypothetical protein
MNSRKRRIHIMLYDKNFLQELDKHTNKTIYARITALSIDEFPID